MLWLALHFPLLPIEALPLRQPPSAVVTQGRVLVADAAAVAAGVGAGQKLSTALGLAPGLSVFEPDPGRERQVLERLACWCGAFTPTLSLVVPDGLLLEIGGCLRLFGGVRPIVDAVMAGCAEQGFAPGWSVAPTPLGARWLARQQAAAICPDRAALQERLAGLPCDIPGWGEAVKSRLAAFGLRHLGDLRAVPESGLRRRIGNGPLDDLARAWGDLPDPQAAFVFPERFAHTLELPARVEQAEGLIFAGQRLFACLAGWLQARQVLLRQATLTMTHDDESPSTLVLRFAEPAADEGSFVRLLREHLGRLQLKAPVEAVGLQADAVCDKPGASAPLFAQAMAGEGALACLERLRARLGAQAVQMMRPVADHRPECATAMADVDFDFGQNFRSTVDFAGQRPLWLLPAPQALAETAGCPQWYGPLHLLSAPERVESGWWDSGEPASAGDVRRDYFVARNPRGQWAWVFRDAQGWFLHGLFA